MKNECLNVAAIVTTGAVIGFFSCIGYFSRIAYQNGFASGFNAARERFKAIIDAAGMWKTFKEFQDEIEKDGTP